MEQNLRQKFMESLFVFKKLKDVLPKNDKVTHVEIMMLRHVFFMQKNSPDIEVTVSDVQSMLEATRPAVSQSLNSLENKGYIKRRISTNDRRVIVIEITPNGEEVLQESRVLIDALLEDIKEEMGEQNFKELVNLLENLSCAIDQVKNKEKR